MREAVEYVKIGRGLRDGPRARACASTPTPTPTGTSSTARPRSSRRRGRPTRSPASAGSCSRAGALRGGDRARSRRRTQQTYEEAADRAKAAPDPDPASILDFVDARALGRRRSGPRVCPTARASRRRSSRPSTARSRRSSARNPRHLHLGAGRRLPGQGRRLQRHQGHAAGVRARSASSTVRSPRTTSSARPTASAASRTKIRVVVEGAEFADYFWPAAEQMVEMSHEYWRTNGKFVAERHGPPRIRRIHRRRPLPLAEHRGLARDAARASGSSYPPSPTTPRASCARRSARAASRSSSSRSSSTTTRWRGPNVPEEFAVPFGKARLRREGTDLTIVAYGTPVHFALEAAKAAREGGQEVEVLDLRSLVPLDFEAIARSVREDQPRPRRPRGQGPRRLRRRDRVADPGGASSRSWTRRSGRVGSDFTPVGFTGSSSGRSCPRATEVLAAARKVLAY